MPRSRRSLVVAAAAGMFLLITFGGREIPDAFSRAAGAPREAGTGARAPDFTLKTFHGGTLSLKSLAGKAVVINFWASWCPPCRAEMPYLERMWQRYRSRGLVILGVNIVQDTGENARPFLRNLKVTYPNVRDEDGRVTRAYGIFALPTTYFVGRDGRVREKFVGGFLGDTGERELRQRIEQLLR